MKTITTQIFKIEFCSDFDDPRVYVKKLAGYESGKEWEFYNVRDLVAFIEERSHQIEKKEVKRIVDSAIELLYK